MKQPAGKKQTCFLRILLMAGLLLILYPLYANLLSAFRADSRMRAYRGTVLSQQIKEQMLEEAEAYNADLASGQIRLYDPFSLNTQKDQLQYKNLLKIGDDGMMGIITVPALDIRLPIYHGTEPSVLEKGAGHLFGTSLPVGGASSHAVITGHTGLSGARLFTDLIQIREGDLIELEILGKELCYRVTDLYVVEPDDFSKLYIEPERDLLTLVTCTPYGVNTHRLLVRSERTEKTDTPEETRENSHGLRRMQSEWMKQYGRSLAAGGGFAALIYILGSFLIKKGGKRKGGKF